jgi:hypothetical protein
MTVTGEVTETGAVSAAIAGASPPPWDGPYAARPHLANLGFLANSDLPDRAGPAYLLVGLRAQPTLRHFDPEVVQYWVTINGRGIRQTVTRSSPLPIDREFSWGLIRTTDRLAVTNEFLTFGGRVRAEMVDDVLVVVFTSPAPILRRGGHSQRWDPGAEHIGAYFARLLLAVDLIPDFERRAAETGVVARYAAFLADAAARFRACPALRDTEPDAWHVLQTEARRVRDTHPADWQAGRELAALAKA